MNGMFLFQQPPPDTSAYMVAGYAVFFTVLVVYLLSLFLRWQNLRRDLSVLEDLEREEDHTA